MSNTSRFIATNFDETSWSFWGLSWLGSLVELAHYMGNVVVVDCGLSAKQRNFLDGINVIRVPIEAKYDVRNLDIISTLSNFMHGKNAVLAYWDHTSYFQDNIADVFDLAKSKFVCCKEQNHCLAHGHSLESFGIDDRVSNEPVFLYELLKHSARKHGALLSLDFFATNAKLLNIFDKFIEHCLYNDLINPMNNSALVCLNIFGNDFGFVSVQDSTWNKAIGNDLLWNHAYFQDGKKVKVMNIPSNMQYSADSAKFHLRNKFPEVYSKWISFYNGNPSFPKLVVKPSLKKTK
jgi:hypothetical protein